MCHDVCILRVFFPTRSSHLTQSVGMELFAIHKSELEERPDHKASWRAAGRCHPTECDRAFTPTGLPSIYNMGHRPLVMSLDLATAGKLTRERTAEEAKRQQLPICVRL
jgi:hypothetical protein